MSGLTPSSLKRILTANRQVAVSLFSRRSTYNSLTGVRLFSQTTPAASQDKLPPSPLGPIGVQAALHAASNPTFKPRPTLFQKEFSLAGRIAVVTGGQRGLGLEMAETLAEAGASVYCLDLPAEPDKTFTATKEYVSRLGLADGARLEYASVDVTKQKAVWDVVERIANKEGRIDVCIAAAGIIASEPALETSQEVMEKVMSVNVNGVLFTAQAAGRQMVRLKSPGSIIMIASMAGTVGFEHGGWTAYCASKSAVKQMCRNMACELGQSGIRVNTVSPGYIYTNMTKQYIDENPHIMERWSGENPLGRIGRPDELRGLVAWLASDASSFCTGSDILITGGHHAW